MYITISVFDDDILGPDSEQSPTGYWNDAQHTTVSRILDVRVESRSCTVAEFLEVGPDGTCRVRLERDHFTAVAVKAEITRG